MSDVPSAPDEYELQSDDTSYVAERRQFEYWASRSDTEKAQDVRRLIERMTKLQENGLRALHPQADDREILLRAAASRLGPAEVRRWTGFDSEQA